MSLIAVSGLDMAAWDAMAKSGPTCRLRYFSAARWVQFRPRTATVLLLTDVATLGDEALSSWRIGFKALKLRLGREKLSIISMR